MTSPRRALTRGLLGGVLLAAASAPAATASPFDPSGALRIVRHAHAQLNANQSSNWFGYNQGTLELGGKQFNSISSDWTVPAASQHTSGQAENSATWIGIGGGCLDAGCALNDVTLIQTGTEQDVDASGHSSYSAWWEVVPAPATTISSMTVAPGDHIHASVSESPAGSELWTVTLRDVTRNESFSTTVPYTSTHSTAEWIEETPLTIGSGGAGQASLPNLTRAVFDHASVNGAAAHLSAGEEVQLIDGSNKVIGAPSAPDAEADGFAACAWATSCSVPPRHKSSRRRHRRAHRRHR